MQTMISTDQVEKTYQRWNERTKERERNLRLINEKRYFDADTPDRVQKFLSRRGFSSGDQREIMRAEKGIPTAMAKIQRPGQALSLERVLGTNDLVGMPFLLRGLQVAKTVGRVWVSDNGGRLLGYGTGFLIAPQLMMTNHHVLPDAAIARTSFVEFNYEMGDNNALLVSEVFQLDPGTFYFSDETLDYTIVSVLSESRNKVPLQNYGYNPLIKEEGKAIISQWLNIIEHPNGEPKQLGLRENQLIDVLDDFLQYHTDTAPGASGSPVFNERWEVVGLHHSGVWATNAAGDILTVDGTIWNEGMGEDKIKWIANEGIRISSIVKHMEGRNLNNVQNNLFTQTFIVPQAIASAVILPPRPESRINANHQSVNVGPDGTVTWSIPVSFSMKIGSFSPGDIPAQSVSAPTAEIPSATQAPLAADSETDILANARETFGKRADVLDVRLGYVFENGWITNKRAVVVTVDKRKSIHELGITNVTVLTGQFMGYPVEVTGPTFEDLIGARLGQQRLESLMVPSIVLREEIRYFPPDNVQLRKVTDQMHVVAHVSPETGWKNLSEFISNTQQSLTVAMYDFGAKHILAGIEAVGEQRDFQQLTLVIQPGESVGEGTKADDLPDADVVKSLLDSLGGGKFKNAWVNIGSVRGWVSSSYHIKVAVRDSSAFWLSSGNWQSSNQPDIDSLEDNRQKTLLRKYNREWHAIVEHPGLADVYEQFIRHDFENNKDNRPRRETLLVEDIDFVYPEVALLIGEEAAVQVQSFEPFDQEREFTVTPLLTPDNFFDSVLDLVRSAESELLIQNQTFNAPKENHLKLTELIEAVLAKQQEGVDVKIIFRVINSADARKNIEALVAMGFDAASIKLQPNCHTKGVIVDGITIMLGSQNWSNDGVSVNRDASLLFDDEPLAQYFRNIFLHDWNNLARQNIGRESLSLELADLTKPIPKGMKLITWKEVKETL